MAKTLKYDVIVVGAGTAGSVAALKASKGAKVALIEAKKPDKIGEKVCGDALGAHHFTASSVPRPPKEAVVGKVDSIVVYSPSGRHGFRVEGEGYALRRKEWGLWLVNEAMDSGAELLHSTKVTQPILREGRVVGVMAFDVNTYERKELFAELVIDASGWTGIIRRSLPRRLGFDPIPKWQDLCICYREVRRLKKPIEHPETARIYLDQEVAPGGYWWFFPHGEDVVNIGLGVQGGRGLDPKELYVKNLSKLPLLKDSELIDGGGGVVPTRRAMHTLVAYGAVFVGDAAYTPNPITGGGIGPAMLSGSIAGRLAAKAVNDSKIMDETMWSINLDYVKAYGMKAASLDIFRLFLQSLSNEDIEFGMEKKLVTDDDLYHISYGKGELSLKERARRLIRGIARPSVLRHLATTASYMKRIRRIYEDYPSSEGFPEWSKLVDSAFDEFKQRLTSYH